MYEDCITVTTNGYNIGECTLFLVVTYLPQVTTYTTLSMLHHTWASAESRAL